MLNGFCQTASRLPPRKCLPGIDVDINLFGLIEKTNQIRSQRRVNCRLSTHRSICRRKKRGGIIDEGNPSSEGTRYKPCQVRYHTAAHSDDPTVSAIALFQHGILNFGLRLSGLTLLSCRKYEEFRLKALCQQSLTNWLCIQITHIGVRDQRQLPDLPQKSGVQVLHQLIDQPMADLYLVAVIHNLFQFYIKYTHSVTSIQCRQPASPAGLPPHCLPRRNVPLPSQNEASAGP